METEQTIAAALGFPKAQYRAVEFERRWLCAELPQALVRQTLAVTDLYISGTQLRLREMRPAGGGPPIFKFSRKVDREASQRLITTIYLSEPEFAVLAAVLPGERLTKTRHRLHSPPGVGWSVDEFDGDLAGLVLVEAECGTAGELAALTAPPFAGREVTHELAYSGGWLVRHGLP